MTKAPTPETKTKATTLPRELRERVRALGLHGLLLRWDELGREPWIVQLVEVEEAERSRRSLERRLRNARIGRFKPIADFDWGWPREVPRQQIEELLGLGFVDEPANAVLLGPNGTGKTMIAKNIAHQALLHGFTVRFTTASDMLHDLAAQNSDVSLARRLHRYTAPQLLVIDEVGYLSYDIRYADLLFEVVTRRYESRATVVSTNKVFAEWKDVFPNAACVVTLVDRLIHRAEIITIDGDSYRLKEAKERAALKATTTSKAKRAPR
jgi:DNA replication protein DnaC